MDNWLNQRENLFPIIYASNGSKPSNASKIPNKADANIVKMKVINIMPINFQISLTLPWELRQINKYLPPKLIFPYGSAKVSMPI